MPSLSLLLRAVIPAVVVLATSTAQAAPPTKTCRDEVDRPQIVVVAGSSAIRPFLGRLASLIAPTTLVYQSQGSCTGVSAIFSAEESARRVRDIPEADGKAANYAVFFNADGSSEECLLSPDGDVVDVGVSDVYADVCGATAPAGVQIADYQGPIQPMTFTVSATSSQRAISAEAAYLVFGLGGHNGAAAPWTDPTYYFVRNASSGTQQMTARAIGVPANQWWGRDQGSSGKVRDGLKILLDPSLGEKAIGILSADVVDAVRGDLRVLAFQDRDQSCAYLPDSTAFVFDKRNVRDGHYPIWGPIHFYARVQSGIPSDLAGLLVSRFAAPRLDPSLIEVIASQHLVPKCAMSVERSEEMGPLRSYHSEVRCDCLYDSLVNGKTDCQPCTSSTECPASAPACSYGFCETP